MNMNDVKVLIVDDEPVTCQLLESELEELNYACKTAFNGNDALMMLKTESFDLVLLDIKLPDMSGIYVLEKIIKGYPETRVIMITGVLDIDTAVLAMKMGASDYIVKPFDLNKLTASVARTILNSKLKGADQTGLRKVHSDSKGGRESPLLDELDAICQGVEQRFDHIIGSSNIVTERTVQIAQRLQIPKTKIRRWEEDRLKSMSDRKNTAYSLRTEDEQKSVSCAIMNAISLLIDKG